MKQGNRLHIIFRAKPHDPDFARPASRDAVHP
jgi:hypothetical protein